MDMLLEKEELKWSKFSKLIWNMSLCHCIG